MSRRLDMLPKKHSDGQQAHKKKFILNFQRNANQNHNEMLPHTCQTGYHQKVYKQQILARMWKRGNLVYCENVNW